MNVENVDGKVAIGTLRPFDDQDTVFRRLVQREFGDFFATAEAVKISVEQRQTATEMFVDQDKCWTVDDGRDGEAGTDALGKHGLAAAQFAGQEDR